MARIDRRRVHAGRQYYRTKSLRLYISELLVTDNQRVKAGDVLVRIDPRD
jgi:hypothetical protein